MVRSYRKYYGSSSEKEEYNVLTVQAVWENKKHAWVC